MKKNFMWMHAAIRPLVLAMVICGLTMTTMTSCSNDDSPVAPVPTTPETLLGEWCTSVNQGDVDEDAHENDVTDMLLSFNENGVIIQRVYAGNKTESVSKWERFRRHGIYSVDNATHTISLKNISLTPATAEYSFDGDQLVLTFDDEENPGSKLSSTLQRPSELEKELYSIYDNARYAHDYIGKWFVVN